MTVPRSLSILIFFLPWMVFGQQTKNTRSSFQTNNYIIEEFHLPGLRQGVATNCIVQGPNDFLWFGTHDGLHRYDGHRVITYKKAVDDTLSVTKSLTFSYIENLYWDSNGKLWVCTYGGGLYQFDPNTEYFRHFKYSTDDSTSISNNYVLCAAEDNEGNLWIGTENGVNRYDPQTVQFQRFLHDPAQKGTLSYKNARNIYLDSQDNLWIATGTVHWGPEWGGLNRFDPQQQSFITYTYDPDDSTSLWTNAVQAMLEDSKGNFWITTTGGLQKMDRDRGTFERMHYNPNKPYAPGTGHREQPSAYSLLEDKTGGLWIGTIGNYDYESHLLRFDSQTNSVEEFPLKSAAWHLMESKDGTIWVSTAGEGGSKIYKIKSKNKSYPIFKGGHIFDEFKNTPLFSKLSKGAEENRWFGPLSSAFDPNDGTLWLCYFFEVGSEDRFIDHAILVNYDKNTELTKFYFLSDLDLQNLNSSAYNGNQSLTWDPVGMTVGKDGKVWGTYPADHIGVYSFDRKTGSTKNYIHNPQDSNSLLSNYVTHVISDSRGMIWAAQFQKGLSRLDPNTGKWLHYQASSNSPHRIGGYQPVSIMESEDGKIWTGGISKDNEPFITAIDVNAGISTDYPCPPGVAAYNFPRYFAQAGDRVFFTLHSQGLGELLLTAPGTLSEVHNPFENNFPIDHISTMVVDQEGHLWLGAMKENRLARFDPNNEKWAVFRSQLDEPVLARRGNLGPDGHIYFLINHKGWIEIDPDKIPFPTTNSNLVRLTDLFLKEKRQIPSNSKILSMPVWQTVQLNIPQQAMPMGFGFSAFHFRTSQVIYKYRLYPHEVNWKTTHSTPEIHYNYLPVGTYTLQIKAFNENGQHGSEPFEQKIVILPPWWKSWWALSLYVLGLFLILASFYYYQRNRWNMKAQLRVEQERAERLRELNQFKSDFYTNITHEFRTPLTVIQGMTQQIKGNESIKTLIQNNSQRLLNLVNQLLDLSKLENNTLNIDLIQADILVFLKYITESCHSLAGSKKINLAFFSVEESIIMDFDPNKIQQILINLLTNAIKFTPAYGSVKVDAVRFSRNGETMLKLQVEDTGKGISEKQIPYIFDRFYQVDDSTTKLGEGSGIGLSLVKELVQLLGGTIEAKSTIGKGSSFTIWLPIRNQAPQSENFDFSFASVGTSSADLSKASQTPLENKDQPLVLVIEDNADVVEYIQSCLSPSYKLLVARNGKIGVEMALEKIPDVILCDIMMPEMDGFEVCQQLKSDRRSSHIPIIIITAKATQEDKVSGLSYGADAYLTKPFDKTELLVRLSNLVKQSQKLQELLSKSTHFNGQLSELEKKEADFLQEIHQIIESNLHDELFNTNELCRAIAMSRTQLYRKLKALTGQSIAQYIRSLRLQKAKSLLESTDLPIGEIASRVGFKDFGHFSRSFQKEFQVPPSGIRK